MTKEQWNEIKEKFNKEKELIEEIKNYCEYAQLNCGNIRISDHYIGARYSIWLEFSLRDQKYTIRNYLWDTDIKNLIKITKAVNCILSAENNNLMLILSI